MANIEVYNNIIDKISGYKYHNGCYKHDRFVDTFHLTEKEFIELKNDKLIVETEINGFIVLRLKYYKTLNLLDTIKSVNRQISELY